MNPKAPTMLDFFEFIYNRQEIWHKRFILKQESPWTKDKWLSRISFCNVYRELDKGTIALLKNVVHNKNYDLNEKIFNILVYRKFNTHYFFDHLSKISPYDFNPRKIIKELESQAKNGIKIWRNAYMVSPPRATKYRPKSKHVQMIYSFKEIAKDIKIFTKALFSMPNYKEAHAFLWDNVPGTGPFLAQQFLIDITYANTPKQWDVNSFVDVGPGARPAAKLLMPENSPIEMCQAAMEIQPIMFDELKEKTGKDWKKIYYKNSILGGKYLRLSDIQNCLCEFRKYITLQINPRKKKLYYRGGKNGL